MDWIVGLLLLLVGVVIGFFVSKYWLEGQTSEQTADNSEETMKELVAQQTAQHIADSRELVSDVQRQCDAFQQRLSAFEELMSRSDSSAEQDKLEFFGGTADAYLSNKQSSQPREKVKSEYQPRDYANSGSGLFAGEDKNVADINEAEKS